ncbi:MAG: SUMF1/EgtB/PvdO family nonheme iron enzyme, partial [Bacteroidota bacterium]
RNYEVFAIALDTDNPRPSTPIRVTHATGFDGLPVFNPDGTKMMWTAQRGDDTQWGGRASSQLWIADFDADAVTRPSPPYLDFTYGMGTRGGYPQVNTTQQAALRFCKWLHQKTGRFFRLPTEAEWEYACLATKEDPPVEDLGDYAWTYANAEEVFHKTGQKKPNGWGLYDMLGNVSEWTLDHYKDDYFTRIDAWPTDPWIEPERKHTRTVRGGHFDAEAAEVGCRIREKSSPKWQARDPQIPKSEWWNVDSPFLGFRLVSPKEQPSPEEIDKFFTKAIIY